MTAYEDGETTASYTYNPDNMRRSKTVNGVKTEHIWVGSEIALEITRGSVVSYMQGIKSNYGWYVYNAHGDVVQICDNDGAVIRSYDYDPYGNQLTEADALDKNPYRYSGEYYDAESGYIYLRARYYDSTTGRFISEDPAFDGFNWYAYCGGNPVNRWDPSGQAWYHWAPGAIMVGSGIALCATGAGATVGIGLIAGGVSSLAASGLGAAGFDSKFVAMATAGLDVVGGAALLLTPFAPVGATMVGAGFGALAGGAISEKLGGSYELGAVIGGFAGAVVGGAAYGKISEMSKISEIQKISATKSPNKVCKTQCFVAGTLIEAADGKKPIEEIQTGDMVLAKNPETDEIALKRVVQTFENESDALVHVSVNGEEIITTPSHPFYVPKLGWTSAIKLRAGDVLVLSNGEYVVVEKVQHEILESPVKVYNFEVEDFHTYFVGESSVLVHNICKVPTAKSGEFNNWFNSLSVDELDELWKNPSTRKAIERQLRYPGGMHEWHMVSRTPQFKYWGISAEEITGMRTAISDVRFVNPSGWHGGFGSTTAHNELLGIIDSSIDYNMFVRRLNNWANYRLKGGIDMLPQGLRLN